MSRWYEGIREESSNIIYSRIRLARNWDEYVFPSRLSEQEASQVTEQLREGLKEAETGEHPFLWNDLAAMNGAQKQALRERRILNRTAVEKNGPGGLYLSEDESCSLLLGADDHIRIQFLAPGPVSYTHLIGFSPKCKDMSLLLGLFLSETGLKILLFGK